ncbi:hypothetical protein CBR_g38430 [Chara braunii]|uniref:SCP domain-containing protein n=1 Tax=Chara braunii TaxID=69332 RepID=A0A388JNN8_CHABU|nr:hypothetical protein CBR_g38430 [Chara braunii]|eukprot:GBG59404.1 hypothetical protein CBR_g38430 [Chara braunii]
MEREAEARDRSISGPIGRSRPLGWRKQGLCPPWLFTLLVMGVFVALAVEQGMVMALRTPQELLMGARINRLRSRSHLHDLNRAGNLNCAADKRMDAITAQGGACVSDDKAALAAANQCKWFGDYKFVTELVSCGGGDPLNAWVSNATTRAVLVDPSYRDIGVASRSVKGGRYWVVIVGTT